jgi:hypothetical protein
MPDAIHKTHLRNIQVKHAAPSILLALFATFVVPFSAKAALGTPTPEPAPPREIPLVEKKFADLSNRDFSEEGRKALAINEAKWKHAETDNWIIHYRRATEAQKVVREVEYDLWFVAKSLGATKDQYKRKSHVFVFADEKEWKTFLAQTDAPQWAASFAHGDDLFLNIREANGQFDSHTLAHETTHAVVSRLYPGKRWPVWLNEGFAEYMGGASVAARRGQYVKGYQQQLQNAGFDLDRLLAMTEYPENTEAVHQFYQSSEKFVRFLMNDLPKERFPKFVTAVLAGKTADAAFVEVYGDKFKDFDTFKKRYKQFNK